MCIKFRHQTQSSPLLNITSLSERLSGFIHSFQAALPDCPDPLTFPSCPSRPDTQSHFDVSGLLNWQRLVKLSYPTPALGPEGHTFFPMAKLETTHGGYYLWKAPPSAPAAVNLGLLFAIATLVVSWRMYKTRTWCCTSFALGGAYSQKYPFEWAAC